MSRPPSDTASLPDDPPSALSATLPASGPPVDHAFGPGAAFGRYTIRDRLGGGGMGEVYSAHDPQLDRVVALKVIRPGLAGESPEARARFSREAQAMARLNHPNVVSVFDAGTVGERVYVTMELVGGPTVAAWLAGAARPWRAIVDVFLQAGRGLAAAHAAGIVHRDFKPSNVIVGDRVRVCDFGLARAVSEVAGEPIAPVTIMLEGVVTRTGHVVGTPAYLAPEQRDGAPASPLSDQYSFGVALREALTGARPGEPAGQRPVPRPLRRVVERALRSRPDDRYPSMGSLLADLARDPARAWRRWLFAAGAGALLGAAALVVAQRQAMPPPCATLPEELWTDTARARVRATFLASGKPYAESTFQRVDASLRARLDAWGRARKDACEATHVRREQSVTILDARMSCLSRARAETVELVTLLGSAEASSIRYAADAVDRLHAIDECYAPRDALWPQADQKARDDIAAAEATIARGWALLGLGQYQQALELGRKAAEAGERVAWAPLEARALVLRGSCEDRLDDATAALATLERAASAAARAHDDTQVAEAMVQRFFVLGESLGRPRDALAGRALVDVVLERAGQPRRARALWLHNLAVVLLGQGQLDDALAAETDALGIWRAVVPSGHHRLVDSLQTEGNIYLERGEYDRAAALLAEVLAMRTQSAGPGHPEVARTIGNLAVLAFRRGDVLGAIEGWGRSRSILRAAGEDNWIMSYNIGQAELQVGRWRDAAGDLAEAMAAAEAKAPGASRPIAATASSLGVALVALGDLDRAAPLLERGVAAARASDPGLLPGVLGPAARLALARGDLSAAKAALAEMGGDSALAAFVAAEIARAERGCRVAREAYAAAIAVAEKEPDLGLVTDATVTAGECGLELGDADAALAILEPRVIWLERMGADPAAAAPAQLALARALVATGGGRARARSLAEAARAGFATLGPAGEPRAARAARWLAANRF